MVETCAMFHKRVIETTEIHFGKPMREVNRYLRIFHWLCIYNSDFNLLLSSDHILQAHSDFLE